MTVTRLLLILFVSGSTLSCGDSGDPSPSRDDGGDAATDGRTVAGDGGAEPQCLPACISKLFQNCRPEGNCTGEARSLLVSRCYENRTIVEFDISGEPVPTLVTLYNHDDKRRVDGFCYKLFYEESPNGERRWVYQDRGANELATVVFPTKEAKQGTATCGGTSYPVDLTLPACADTQRGIGGEKMPVMCTMGQCRAN
jgi:hypothetical protein